MTGEHLSGEAILRAIDGDLSREDAALVAAHLAACSACRERSDVLSTASLQAAQVREEIEIPPPHAAARRLRDTLALESERPRFPARALTAPALVACASAVIVLTIGWLSGHSASAAFLPIQSLTPGATKAITRDQLCGGPEREDGGAIPDQVAYRVFEQYRIRSPRPGAYEVDYLITPALGGSDDIRNLWPQPYAEGTWNSRVKDALEDHLRAEVCAGRIDLAAAQREIASDWIASYRKRFRTREPLAEHAMFFKDQPWQGELGR